MLDPGALAGTRLGVWRDGSKAASAATAAVLDAAVATLRSLGAEVIDPVGLPGADEISEPEMTALLHEFKHDLNAYLAALPADGPASLTELIAFNIRNGDRVLAHFGQEIFEQAEATSGDRTTPPGLPPGPQRTGWPARLWIARWADTGSTRLLRWRAARPG